MISLSGHRAGNATISQNPSDNRLYRRQSAACFIALIGAPFLLFVDFIAGSKVFIGNSDRLNNSLNIKKLYIDGFQEGHIPAWIDNYFMGMNTLSLPYIYPSSLHWVESLFQGINFYYYSTLSVVILSALAGILTYSYLNKVLGSRFSAVVGGLLYQFSALAILKLSQNDSTYAVFIVIPAVLNVIYDLRPERFGIKVAALWLLLAAMLLFMFLQTASYAMLLFGAYAIFISAWRREWYPVTGFSVAAVSAIVIAFPRVLTVAEGALSSSRLAGPAPGAPPHVTGWPEIFRWFSDDILGRAPTEVFALGNPTNLSEGMLMSTSVIAPVLILSFVILLAKHAGTNSASRRAAQNIAPPGATLHSVFFLGVMAFTFAVVFIGPVQKLLWLGFFRLDFIHDRILIIGLLPMVGIIAIALSIALKLDVRRPTLKAAMISVAIGASAAAFGWLVSWGIEDVQMLPRSLRVGPISLLSSEFIRVLLGNLLLFALVVTWWCKRKSEHNNYFIKLAALMVAAFMIIDATWNARLGIAGPQLRTELPFQNNAHYLVPSPGFVPPSKTALELVHQRLARNAQRVALVCPPQIFTFYPGCAAHMALFWDLRLVEGYFNGVPSDLAALPWPSGQVSKRDIKFSSIHELNWALLGQLNVGRALVADLPLFVNRIEGTGVSVREILPSDLSIVENPEYVAPRIIVPARIETVNDRASAVASWTNNLATYRPEDVVYVEDSKLETPQAGEITDLRVKFDNDRIELNMPATGRSRFIVLNERYHKDWQGSTQTRDKVELHRVNGLFLGIAIPPGTSSVTLSFVPFMRSGMAWFFYIGGGLALLVGIILLVVHSRRIGEERKPPNFSPH